MKWRWPGRIGLKGLQRLQEPNGTNGPKASNGQAGPEGMEGMEGMESRKQDSVAAWRACHRALERLTPLARDCGALCGGRCCQGGPEDGMLLFPGEEALYPTHTLPAGWTVRDSEIMLPDRTAPVRLLVCNGQCDRRIRPVSCRIFPLLPFVDEDGELRADPDMRAFAMCPLLSSPDAPRIRPAFIRGVCGALTTVIDEPGVRSLLALLAEENRLAAKFHGLSL